MLDLTLATLITRILAALPIIGLHGLSLAMMAKLLGDRQPERDGRLTVNPIAHLDLFGLLGFIVLGTGWIRPMPLQLNRIRAKYFAFPMIVIASLLPVAFLAALAVYLLPWAATAFSFSTAPLVGGFLVVLVRSAIGFTLLNLLPIPPFSCAHILGCLHSNWAILLRRFQWPAGIAILVIGVLILPSIVLVTNATIEAVFGNISMLIRAQ